MVVTNPAPGGGASSPLNFASIIGAGLDGAPTLASLSPASAVAGAASQTLTLTGTNFLASSTVTYNGVGHAATFVSSTQLTIGLTAADQATTGSYAVVVTNPAPGGGASSPLNFAVNNPVPTLASLSPASALVGAASQTLTLTGTNFLASSTVTYNGVGHAATFVSSTQLTIGLTAADQATAGSYAVVVTNPAPGGGTSSPLNFTVASPIVSLSTTSLAFGNQPIDMTSAAQTVTLSNTGNAALSITSLTLTGTNASDFEQTNTCGSSLAAGANCTIAVMFTPSIAGDRGGLAKHRGQCQRQPADGEPLRRGNARRDSILGRQHDFRRSWVQRFPRHYLGRGERDAIELHAYQRNHVLRLDCAGRADVLLCGYSRGVE